MDIRFDTQLVDISVALNALKLYREGKYKEAIENLVKILDGEPENWDARLMLAASYYKTGQYASAERNFARLIDKCEHADICKRAQVGLQASTDKLHNPDQSDGNSAKLASKPLPAGNDNATTFDATQTSFLRWLDKKEALS